MYIYVLKTYLTIPYKKESLALIKERNLCGSKP